MWWALHFSFRNQSSLCTSACHGQRTTWFMQSPPDDSKVELHFESFDMVVEIIRFALRIKTKARSACPICHSDKPRYAKMFFPCLSLLYKTYGLPYKSIGYVSSIGTGSILFHYLIVSRIVFDNITSHLIWSSYKIVIFIVDMTYGGLARDFSGNHTLKIPRIPIIPYYIGTRQVIKFL